METDRTPQLVTKISQLATTVLVLFIFACASNRTHMPPTQTSSPQPTNASGKAELKSSSRPKIILRGQLDCRSQAVQITGGVVDEKRFQDLQEAGVALKQKNYDGTLLNEIENLRVCEITARPPEVRPEGNQSGPSTADFKPSFLLELETKDNFVLFSLSQVDFNDFGSVAAYLKEVKDQEACKAISGKCVKCSDKKIYCSDGHR